MIVVDDFMEREHVYDAVDEAMRTNQVVITELFMVVPDVVIMERVANWTDDQAGTVDAFGEPRRHPLDELTRTLRVMFPISDRPESGREALVYTADGEPYWYPEDRE